MRKGKLGSSEESWARGILSYIFIVIFVADRTVPSATRACNARNNTTIPLLHRPTTKVSVSCDVPYSLLASCAYVVPGAILCKNQNV